MILMIIIKKNLLFQLGKVIVCSGSSVWNGKNVLKRLSH